MEPWKYGLSKPPHQLMGEYWAKDNAAFEASDPTLARRAVRYLNPLENFGSAVGMMHETAQQHDQKGMALAVASATPLFGAARTFKGIFGPSLSNNWNVFSARLGRTVGTGALADVYTNPIDISFGSKSFVSKEGGSHE